VPPCWICHSLPRPA